MMKIVTGAPNDTQQQDNVHTKNSLIDSDGVLLTNVQCHMVPVSIFWYIKRKLNYMQLKVHLKPDRKQ